jgi:hypothetical protein
MNEPIVLTTDQLDTLLENAAERGADSALKKLGFNEKDAEKDWNELRSLLDAWRQVKKGALNTLGKFIMGGLLTALVAGVYVWYPGKH